MAKKVKGGRKPKNPEPEKTAKTDRSEHLDRAREIAKQVNKKLAGSGRVDVGSDIELLEYQYESTGHAAADYVSNGGLVRGRIAEWWGPEASAKTTSCAAAAKAFQKRGLNVALVPIEGIDKAWWRQSGVYVPYSEKEMLNYDRGACIRYNKMYKEAGYTPLSVIQHKAPDAALDLTYQFTQANVYDLIIVDSLAMAIPSRIIEGKNPSDASEHGGNASLIQNWVRYMQSAFNTSYDENNNISRTGSFPNMTCVIAINQARDTMNSRAFAEYKQLHPPGGWALRHGKSQSVFFGKVEDHGPYVMYDGTRKREVTHKTFRTYGTKMRGGPEGREARFNLHVRDWTEEDGFNFRAGYLDNAPTVRALAVMMGIVDVAGSYYSYGEQRIQGKDRFDRYLREHPEMLDTMYREVIDKAKRESSTGTVPTEILP